MTVANPKFYEAREEQAADDAFFFKHYIKDQYNTRADLAKAVAGDVSLQKLGLLGVWDRREAEERKERRSSIPVVKVKESRTYTKGGPNSFVRDMVLSMNERMGNAASLPSRSGEALTPVERLKQHAKEQQHIRISTPSTPLEARERDMLIAYELQSSRSALNIGEADKKIRELRDTNLRSHEFRATAAGDFAPPQYLVEDYGAYFTAAGNVSAQAQQKDLPRYGLTVDVPIISGAFNVTSQSSENASLSQSSPSATFSTVSVDTLATVLEVSQQLLDRSAIDIDQVFAEGAGIAAATELDSALVVPAIIAAGGTISDAGSNSISALFTDVNTAAYTIATTAGQAVQPTHIWMPSNNWRFYAAQLDTTNRPIFPPQAGGTGARAPRYQAANSGYTGFDIAGMKVFESNNLGTTSGKANVLVGAPLDGLTVYKGLPTLEVWPQSAANALQAYATFRLYVSWAIKKSQAFQTISGAAYPVSPTI